MIRRPPRSTLTHSFPTRRSSDLAPVTIRLQRNAAGNRTVSSPSGHPDPEGFLTTLREAFALLDYRNFARFIEDSPRSEEHTSELQSLMRNSYAVFCLKKKHEQ